MEKGLVKEIFVIVVAILILSYLNIDIDTAADFIKKIFNSIISLIK